MDHPPANTQWLPSACTMNDCIPFLNTFLPWLGDTPMWVVWNGLTLMLHLFLCPDRRRSSPHHAVSLAMTLSRSSPSSCAMKTSKFCMASECCQLAARMSIPVNSHLICACLIVRTRHIDVVVRPQMRVQMPLGHSGKRVYLRNNPVWKGKCLAPSRGCTAE